MKQLLCAINFPSRKGMILLLSQHQRRCSLSAQHGLMSKTSNDSSEINQLPFHPIMDVIDNCQTLEECYHAICANNDYISTLKIMCNEYDGFGNYTMQHHKYVLLRLLKKARNDRQLEWETLFSIFDFYSKFERYKISINNLYNFLSILAQRGDFNSLETIVQNIVSNDKIVHNSEALINSRLFSLLMKALRLSNKNEMSWKLFEQCIKEFDIRPSLDLLSQAYMSNCENLGFDFIKFCNKYDTTPSHSSFNTIVEFHIYTIRQNALGLAKVPYLLNFNEIQRMHDSWNTNSNSNSNSNSNKKNKNNNKDNAIATNNNDFFDDEITHSFENDRYEFEDLKVSGIDIDIDNGGLETSSQKSRIPLPPDLVQCDTMKTNIQLHLSATLYHLNKMSNVYFYHARFYNNNKHNIFIELFDTMFDYLHKYANKLAIITANQQHSMMIDNINSDNNDNGNMTTSMDSIDVQNAKEQISEWLNKIIESIVKFHLPNHNQSLIDGDEYGYLKRVFKGCLSCNQFQLARNIWQYCEEHSIAINDENKEIYQKLTIRNMRRHGPTSSKDVELYKNYRNSDTQNEKILLQQQGNTTDSSSVLYDSLGTPLSETNPFWTFFDSSMQFSVYPKDSAWTESSNSDNSSSNSNDCLGVLQPPQPNATCFEMATNLLQRSDNVAATMHRKLLSQTIVRPQQMEVGVGIGIGNKENNRSEFNFARTYHENLAPQTFLTDLTNALKLCYKYKDVISGRMLYVAFINSKVAIARHPKIATDFLYLLDHPQYRQFVMKGTNIDSDNFKHEIGSNGNDNDNDDGELPLIISPKDVMSLWPAYPPQAFVSQAFEIFYRNDDIEGMVHLWNCVLSINAQNEKNESRKKQLNLTPKMFRMTGEMFVKQIESYSKNEIDDGNMYMINNDPFAFDNLVEWKFLWNMLENRRFKGIHTRDSIQHVGIQMLNQIINLLELHSLQKQQQQQQQSQQQQRGDEGKIDLEMDRQVMKCVHRIHDIFNKFDITLPFKSMQRLHSCLNDKKEQSWIRQLYLNDNYQSINDYRWFMDEDTLTESIENGLYRNFDKIRQLMRNGTIFINHKLIHRILRSFCNAKEVDLTHFLTFLHECKIHQHALSIQEKTLIRNAIKKNFDNWKNSTNYNKNKSNLIDLVGRIRMNHDTTKDNNSNNNNNNESGLLEFESHKQKLIPATTTTTTTSSNLNETDNNGENTAQLIAPSLPIGTIVQLKDLTHNEEYNGKQAIVIGNYDIINDIYPLRLNVDNTNNSQKSQFVALSPQYLSVLPQISSIASHLTPVAMTDTISTSISTSTSTQVSSSDVITTTPTDTTTKAAIATSNKPIIPFDSSIHNNLKNRLIHVFENSEILENRQNEIDLDSLKQLWHMYGDKNETKLDLSNAKLHSFIICNLYPLIDYKWKLVDNNNNNANDSGNNLMSPKVKRVYFLNVGELTTKQENEEKIKIKKYSQFKQLINSRHDQIKSIFARILSKQNGVMSLKDLISRFLATINNLDDGKMSSLLFLRYWIDFFELLPNFKQDFQVFVVRHLSNEVFIKTKKQDLHLFFAYSDMTKWSVSHVCCWLDYIYNNNKNKKQHNNVNINGDEWFNICGLFEYYQVNGYALSTLTEKDMFDQMSIESMSIIKFILNNVERFRPPVNDEHRAQIKTNKDLMTSKEQQQRLIGETDRDKNRKATSQNNPLQREKTQHQFKIGNKMKDINKDKTQKNQFDIIISKIISNLDYRYGTMNLDTIKDIYLNSYDINKWKDIKVQQILINQFYTMFKFNSDNTNNENFTFVWRDRLEENEQDIAQNDFNQIGNNFSDIISQHPIGVDLLSLLQEYENTQCLSDLNAIIEKFGSFTNCLNQFGFIVKSSNYGYFVYENMYSR